MLRERARPKTRSAFLPASCHAVGEDTGFRCILIATIIPHIHIDQRANFRVQNLNCNVSSRKSISCEAPVAWMKSPAKK